MPPFPYSIGADWDSASEAGSSPLAATPPKSKHGRSKAKTSSAQASSSEKTFNGSNCSKSASIKSEDRGMTVGYKQVYSGKEDRKGRFIWQTGIPDDLAQPVEDAESEKWAIIVRHIRVYNNPKKVLSLHSIVIQSPFIKVILEDVLRGYPGVTVNLKNLEFTGRFEPLIHRWPALRRAISDLQKRHDEQQKERNKDKEEGGDGDSLSPHIEHAKLLDDLLVKEFSDIEESMSDMQRNGVTTFEHLWTIFQPNTLLFTRYENQDRALRLQASRYGVDRNQQPVYWLTGVYVDFDGQRFGTQKMNVSISSFEGTRRINSLRAFPMDLHEQQEKITATLVERGAKVEALSGSHFRNYNGIGWRMNMMTRTKEKITVKGRIVIDSFGYNRFQPDSAVYVVPLNASAAAVENSVPPGHPMRAHLQRRPRISNEAGFPTFIDPTYNLDEETDEDGMPADGFFDDENNAAKRPGLTEEQLLICTPLVRGYSLKEKVWLNFFVNAVSDISFNEHAFSSLNLPKHQKELILGFTSVKQSYRTQFDDVIEGKGKGIIILLSGPPGVGKTLTAESVAEQMKVPLYVMAAGDLGLDPRHVETKLQGVMSMCSRWGAILLLDEADIFLEERSLHELERNKLVSIFLRVLEYYEGIMFLTTNRVSTFDAAFQSRIHISLEYPELDKKSRKGIWANFLSRHDAAQAEARKKPTAPLVGTAKTEPAAKKRKLDDASATNSDAGAGNGVLVDEDGDEDPETKLKLTQPHAISEKDMEKLASIKLNGRQIKNILKTAQLLATFKKEPLGYSHIDTVIDTTQHLHKATVATDSARGAVYS